jgi:F-type H+-transporting ATPase subunit alpha
LTGLPIIETKGNDVSAYIPTNVISITDGQIFLETDLFNSGVRPAINVGVSVSRVGGNAQTKAMKGVAGRLRLDLAQYRELEAFSAFGSDLDKASKAQLERGARLVELLKQPQYTPYPVERQVVSMWAGTSGAVDDVPVADVSKFEREFLEYVGRQHKGIYDAVLSGGKLDDSLVEQLENAISDFKKQFETSDGKGIGGDAPKPKTDKAEDSDKNDDGDAPDKDSDEDSTEKAKADTEAAEDDPKSKADAASDRSDGDEA